MGNYQDADGRGSATRSREGTCTSSRLSHSAGTYLRWTAVRRYRRLHSENWTSRHPFMSFRLQERAPRGLFMSSILLHSRNGQSDTYFDELELIHLRFNYKVFQSCIPLDKCISRQISIHSTKYICPYYGTTCFQCLKGSKAYGRLSQKKGLSTHTLSPS